MYIGVLVAVCQCVTEEDGYSVGLLVDSVLVSVCLFVCQYV